MHCLFVSNCEKKALARTRSLLDRYAVRVGDRAWATPITQAALDAVQAALSRGASRHTSVACYVQDANLGTRLRWIVGPQTHDDSEGRFVVATAKHDTPLPPLFRHAALLARMQGYGHDFGKVSARFQDKLRASTTARGPQTPQGDYIRHEWISAFLLKDLWAMPAPWTTHSLQQAWEAFGRQQNSPQGPQETLVTPFTQRPLDTGLQALLYGVATHHGALGGTLCAGGHKAGADGSAHVRPAWKNQARDIFRAATSFSRLPAAETRHWNDLLANMQRVKTRLLARDLDPRAWESAMLIARAALILADHEVSARPRTNFRQGDGPAAPLLYANTHETVHLKTTQRGFKKTTQRVTTRVLKQPLGWHLRTVGDAAGRLVRLFVGRDLPGLSSCLSQALLAHRAPDPESRFAWQDRAVDCVQAQNGPQLIFNVASTGSGKTLANLKMAAAARHASDQGQGVRLAIAFNLRSLTRQTFEAYKKHFAGFANLFDAEFSCLLGSRGGLPFQDPDHARNPAPGQPAELDFLCEDESDVRTQDDADLVSACQTPVWVQHLSANDPKLQSIVATPVLISTIDWISAAGEPGRQAQHAKALLRVASSDLILDDVDSYDVKALVAVLRVVFMAALFGRNVIVSSATLNPTLAQALSRTYAAGNALAQHSALAPSFRTLIVGDKLAPTVSQADAHDRVDLYRTTLAAAYASSPAHAHAPEPRQATVRYRLQALDTCAPAPQASSASERFFQGVRAAAHALHAQTAQPFNPDSAPGARLSIGLVRVANISTCIDVAERLRASGEFVVCAYHAQELRARRAWRERQLDRVLYRTDEAWRDALLEVYPALAHAQGDVRLVVVATPVEEIGRDHDFDWAVIEPSSLQSIIQTAGRVNRHRRVPLAPGAYNVVILQRNLQSLRNDHKAVFVRPGLELRPSHAADGVVATHPSHDLETLMSRVSGAPRDDILDAGLVFDEGGRRAVLAACDEAALAQVLDLPLNILQRQQGWETQFMLNRFVSDYPLRDVQTQFDFDVIYGPPSAGAAQYFVAPTWSAQVPKDLGSLAIHPTPEGTWLVPTEQDVQQVLAQQNTARDSFSLRAGKTPKAISWLGLLARRPDDPA